MPLLSIYPEQHRFAPVEEQLGAAFRSPDPGVLSPVKLAVVVEQFFGYEDFGCEVQIDDDALLAAGFDASVQNLTLKRAEDGHAELDWIRQVRPLGNEGGVISDMYRSR